MPHLGEVLARLGLTSYQETLTRHGFRDWDTVLDITEEDLSRLGFKLGHRRSLQREIATFRGLPASASLDAAQSPVDLGVATLSLQSSPPPREKRRYRRHPRADPNAPRKPKTAYVNFADQLRTHPDIRTLSFVDIAKEVGRQWQILPPEQKRVWESQAARAMQEYELQMDEYKKTDSWRKYQIYLAEFKATHNQNNKTKRPSTNRPDSFVRAESSRASPASTESLSPHIASEHVEDDVEVRHKALTLAFSELISLRGEILLDGVSPYDEQHLPPESLTRRAMHAFVQGTSSLLHMWTHAQVDDIADAIYRRAGPIDPMTLAECFTVTAMGSHYDPGCFPSRIRRVLCASATLHFNEQNASFDYFRTTRLLLSLSFYAVIEKHMSARYLVAAGLQIARWRYPLLRHGEPTALLDMWRRLFQSLIFTDCWLSYTLGYPPDVTADDIAFACTPFHLDAATIEELVQTQTSKIGLVAAEIGKTLASPDAATRTNIDMLAQKLEAWRRAVPRPLQLEVVTTSNPANLSVDQKRAVLLVYILYMGAIILLYRQTLVASTEAYLTDDTGSQCGDARPYRDECGEAARQIAHILRVVTADGVPNPRCWLLIYWSFTACIVLMFTATHKLVDGDFEIAGSDLSCAQTCIDILRAARADEHLAPRFLDIIAPLHHGLRQIHQRVVGKARTSIFMLVQSDPSKHSPPIPVSKEEVRPCLEKLCELLTDPFGRNQQEPGGRRMLNADGSYSEFWWK
ncbi:hypothetical protein M011DRAFT_400755 [Sporormia fimetaria CBS 119925]|uniref:HMG box domain-containing protein n=1 Tax=Sporormia fimetaria CBS 119925 TaxID=1340428 RepID=A0A6A6VDM7_9PLEO|nr:hypothetical protein M011DRAFT_400755 [Sporormia fimetaria CBS 119925]